METDSVPVPPIDHVVIDVQDRMEEGVARYRSLGFRLTERGRHSLGSINHLAVFGPDYLELLGAGEAGGAARADLAGFPAGLNGLVFAMEGAEARHAELAARGAPVQPVQSFTRPVALPDGSREDARFRTVRLQPRAMFDGRVYFCEHLTPHLVWRPEWQEHPNGAIALSRVVLAVADPARTGAAFERLLGAGAVEPDGRVLTAGTVRVEFAPRDQVARDLGDLMPDPAGRGDHMALLGIRVRSLQHAADVLRGNGVAGLRIEDRRILVPAEQAMNVALEFIE